MMRTPGVPRGSRSSSMGATSPSQPSTPSFVPPAASNPDQPSDAVNMKLILCVFVALLSFGIKASAAPDPNFHVYLCFGQSNMESGGKMDEMGLHYLLLQPGR